MKKSAYLFRILTAFLVAGLVTGETGVCALDMELRPDWDVTDSNGVTLDELNESGERAEFIIQRNGERFSGRMITVHNDGAEQNYSLVYRSGNLNSIRFDNGDTIFVDYVTSDAAPGVQEVVMTYVSGGQMSERSNRVAARQLRYGVRGSPGGNTDASTGDTSVPGTPDTATGNTSGTSAGPSVSLARPALSNARPRVSASAPNESGKARGLFAPTALKRPVPRVTWSFHIRPSDFNNQAYERYPVSAASGSPASGVPSSFDDFASLFKQTGEESIRRAAVRQIFATVQALFGVDLAAIAILLESFKNAHEAYYQKQLLEMRAYYDGVVALLKQQFGMEIEKPEFDPSVVTPEELAWRQKVDDTVRRVQADAQDLALQPEPLRMFMALHAALIQQTLLPLKDRYDRSLLENAARFIEQFKKLLDKRAKAEVITNGDTTKILVQLSQEQN